eukprot:4641086-Ditylum_brightwellii.AAC.1
MKFKLLALQQQLNSSARMSQVLDLQQAMQRICKETERYNVSVLGNFRNEIDAHINHNLAEVQAWFEDLDAAVKKRQSNLDARISSCAKECELLTFKENTKSDFVDVNKCIEHIDNQAEKNHQSIIMFRKQHSYMTFHRRHNEWKRRMLLYGWSRWKTSVEKEKEMMNIFLRRKKSVKRLLLHHTFEKKRKSFDKWTKFLRWHREVEKRKETASKVIHRMMYLSVTAPMAEAFNKWHRNAIIEKMNKSYESRTKHRENGEKFSEGVLQDDEVDTNKDDLMSMMNTFKNDAGGASSFLAHQLQNIKSYDIKWLREDSERERRKLSDNVDQALAAAMEHVRSRTNDLEKSMGEKIKALTAEFPPIKKQLSGLTNSLIETRNNLQNIAESHGRRVELLFEKKDSLDEKIILLEEGLQQANNHILNLTKGRERSDEAIKQLASKLDESNLHCTENTRNLQSLKEQNEKELKNVKDSLGENRTQWMKLSNKLSDTQIEMNQYQDMASNEFQQ